MPEPFSIATGTVGIVVAVLHVTRKLTDDVKSIIDAPAAIQALRDDLQATVLALESLKDILETEWQSLGPTVAEQANHAMKAWGSACDIFRSDLQRWTRRSRSGELSWRDRTHVGFWKERQIKAMSEHLQSCKLACTSVATMGTLYSSLRNGRVTEELMNTIATSRISLSVIADQNSSNMALVRQSLADLTGDDAGPANRATMNDGPANDDEEDDRTSMETQLYEQQAVLEACQKLFAQLQSMLQDDEIRKVTTGKSGDVNVTFGSITGGVGVGVSNAPMSNVFGASPPAAADSTFDR